MRIGIVIITYCRLDMIKYTIPKLLKCRGIKNYPVYIAQDGGPEALPVINYMKKVCDKNKWIIRVPAKRLGLPTNFITGINEAFEVLNLDAVIVGEDDVVFSKDCLEFLSWALDHFKDNKDIFGISAHTPERVTCVDDEVGFRAKVNFTGAAIARKNWEYYYRYWVREGYPAKGIWSPDACMDNVLTVSKKLGIYPTNARASHVGWYGTNITIDEAKAKGFDNRNVMWTRCPNFKEDHQVKEYKILPITKVDAWVVHKAKGIYPHNNPWVDNWRVG